MKLSAILFVSLLVLIGSYSALSANEGHPESKIMPVVSTDWLAKHLQDNDLIVLHIGPKGSYEEKHIPGSRAASLMRLNRTNEAGIRDEMLPDDDIASALSEIGISNNSRIVIYFFDEGASWAVARYLLILEYVGMKGRVAYLDGGLPKWIVEDRPVTSEASEVVATDFDVTIDPNVVVDIKWSADRTKKSGFAFIDGRPPEGYSGLSGHWDRLGHIPGAGNIPFYTLLAEDPPYLLKSREELSDLFQKAGAKSGDTVVVYCGTGLWASLPYLVAKYLDYEVRLFDGSFQEWSATENLPVAVKE